MDDRTLAAPPAGGHPAGALRSWTPHLAGLPVFSVALLPKCPACLMIVFGALGVGHGSHELALRILQVVAVAVLLCVLALRRRGLGPLLLGVAGGAGIIVGQFADLLPAVLPGALLLGAAWLWNGRRRPGVPACGCHAAEPAHP